MKGGILLLQIILVQTVIFGAVIYILKKLMWGSTESAVNRLNQEYMEISKKREELTLKIQQMEEECQRKKAEAEKVAAEIRDTAEKEMYAKRDDIIKRAKMGAERIIKEVLASKNKIREEIQKEEQLRMLDFCELVLRKTFKDYIRGEINNLLVRDFLQEFQKMDLSPVPPYIKEVEIVTYEKLSDEMRKVITENISSKLQRKIVLKESVDKSILGGIVIKFGTLVIDESLAGKLRESVLTRKQEIEGKV